VASAASWLAVAKQDIFSPNVAGKLLSNGLTSALTSQLSPLTSMADEMLGPIPEMLGFKPDQIPHLIGEAAKKLMHARIFSKPSAATKLGASKPTKAPHKDRAMLARSDAHAAGPAHGGPAKPHALSPKGPQHAAPGVHTNGVAPRGPATPLHAAQPAHAAPAHPTPAPTAAKQAPAPAKKKK
jgi:hypothetical protein